MLASSADRSAGTWQRRPRGVPSWRTAGRQRSFTDSMCTLRRMLWWLELFAGVAFNVTVCLLPDRRR